MNVSNLVIYYQGYKYVLLQNKLKINKQNKKLNKSMLLELNILIGENLYENYILNVHVKFSSLVLK